MTALFGVCGLTPDAALESMTRMVRRAGAGGPGDCPAAFPAQMNLPGMAIGMRASRSGGAQHCRITRDGPLWLALRCRLDDRTPLLTAAGQPLDSPASDADLVLAAYRRYGLDCVQHLFGDWVVALWDDERKRLLLARDTSGDTTLFWWQGSRGLIFATALPLLLAAGPVPTRPDPHWIAGLLTVFSDPARPTVTAFDDVHTLPAGRLLFVEGGRTEVRRWWAPEALPSLDAMPLPELQAQCLALYEDAVRQRLRRSGGSGVAATLSGGLDSGSVVALAAPALAEEGTVLPAFVHVPRFDTGDSPRRRTPNEWALASATASHVGNVRAIACPTVHISPVAAIRTWLDIVAEPNHAAGNLYWLLDIVQQARDADCRVLLIGRGGNATVSYSGTGDLRPRLRARQWALVRSELHCETAGRSSALWRRLIKPTLRPVWQQLKRTISANRTAPWADISLLNPASSLGMDFESVLVGARHADAFYGQSPARLADWRLRRSVGRGGMAALGAAHGVEVRDPTMDRRLAELCWRLPDELYWAHGGQRGLIRVGMRGQLPDQVLDNPSKGLQSADLRPRLLACSAELRDEVAAVAKHPLVADWIDLPRLELSAQAALDPHGPRPAHAVAPDQMLRGLQAAMFIARHG